MLPEGISLAFTDEFYDAVKARGDNNEIVAVSVVPGLYRRVCCSFNGAPCFRQTEVVPPLEAPLFLFNAGDGSGWLISKILWNAETQPAGKVLEDNCFAWCGTAAVPKKVHGGS